MSLSTLVKFLYGDREAILTIARSPQALWIGFLFVMGAALAREYDKESLLNEPWHLLLPLAASLLTSFVLFNLFYWPPRYTIGRPPFGSAYRSFLQVFWMTAPMAWLYAIPWERIMESPGDAAAANLWTLGLVSAWRVLLITRVLSVLFNMNAIGAFFIVMLYSHIAAYFAIASLPFSIISLMGGVQLGESEQAIAGIAAFVVFFGVLLVPFWLIGTVAAFAMALPKWELTEQTFAADSGRAPAASGSLRHLAMGLIAFGLALLPLTQPEQMRRYKAETLLRTDIDAAITFMSEHDRADFPPHWDPPPRLGYHERRPDLEAVADRIIEAGAAEWVRAAYLAKLDKRVRANWYVARRSWLELAREAEDQEDPERLWWLDSGSDRLLRAILSLDTSLSSQDRAAVAILIEKAKEREGARNSRTSPRNDSSSDA